MGSFGDAPVVYLPSAFTHRTGGLDPPLLTQSRGESTTGLDGLQNERYDGQNDEDDNESLGDVPTETGDTSSAENARDECEYQKENCQFDQATSELQWVHLYRGDTVRGN